MNNIHKTFALSAAMLALGFGTHWALADDAAKAALDALVESQPVLVRISAAKRLRDAAERAARIAGEDQVTPERVARMDEAASLVDAFLRGETVTKHTDWFELNEARLQMTPYSRPSVEIAVASQVSPTGASAAGRQPERPGISDSDRLIGTCRFATTRAR